MDKIRKRLRRKRSIRKKVFGTSEKPRMTVHKSNRNIGVQLIDDIEGKTVCSLSTLSAELKGKFSAYDKKNTQIATALGGEIAKIAVSKNIKKVVFDRSGYRYHGVVKAIADEARKNGLEF